MSKLAEQVQKTLRVEPRRLGFGAVAPAAIPSLVIVAQVEPGTAASGVEGADALLVRGDAGSLREKSSLPFGLLIPDLTAAAAESAAQAGVDVLVFDPDRTEAAALLTSDMGFVATVSPELTDVELRVLEALPLDALYLQKLPRLTVRGQLAIQRIAVLAHHPLLVPAGGLSAAELQALREAGVSLLLAESAKAVQELRTAVAALPPRRHRRDGQRPEVVLPRAPAAEEQEEEEEEEFE